MQEFFRVLSNTPPAGKLLSHGLIAQWIEHPPSKRAVAGSSPAQSDRIEESQQFGFRAGLEVKRDAAREPDPEKPGP